MFKLCKIKQFLSPLPPNGRHKNRSCLYIASSALIVLTLSTENSLASDSSPDTPEPDPADFSEANQGLVLESHFGTVGGSFLIGGGLSSPWMIQTFRVNLAMGAAFYSGELAGSPGASWTPFAYGHARLEVGPPFLKTSPIRPYGFGGVVLSVLPGSMSDEKGAVGGLGGIGLEAGFSGSNAECGPVTYALEFAGVGSHAEVTTPVGSEDLLSGFSAAGVIRGYFW